MWAQKSFQEAPAETSHGFGTPPEVSDFSILWRAVKSLQASLPVRYACHQSGVRRSVRDVPESVCSKPERVQRLAGRRFASRSAKPTQVVPQDCQLRRVKYLKNVIEQEHRFIKKNARLKIICATQSIEAAYDSYAQQSVVKIFFAALPRTAALHKIS
jgi:hypothetical protein